MVGEATKPLPFLLRDAFFFYMLPEPERTRMTEMFRTRHEDQFLAAAYREAVDISVIIENNESDPLYRSAFFGLCERIKRITGSGRSEAAKKISELASRQKLPAYFDYVVGLTDPKPIPLQTAYNVSHGAAQ